jgi:hypothetical protein
MMRDDTHGRVDLGQCRLNCFGLRNVLVMAKEDGGEQGPPPLTAVN